MQLLRQSLQKCAALNTRYFSASSSKKFTPNTNEKPFKVLQSEGEITIDLESFKKNEQHFAKYVETLKQAEEIAKAGGGEKSIERHVKRHRKLMITDRVKLLVDDIDDFMELSLTAGIGMEYGHVPRGSTLTGIGKVRGRYCIILANDGAFKGGAVYPITLKKQLRAQEIAEQNRLPCIYLVDSAGAFLPLQSEIFNLGGRSFFNEAVLGAAKIPQMAIVCGSCTAGGAYVPTMADDAVIVKKTGTIFLAGPPLVKAALGEIISPEDLGGAIVHCGTSGCTDYFAEDETAALQLGRDIVSSLNVACNEEKEFLDYDEPVFDVNEIPGIIPHPDCYSEINMFQIIARLVDGSRFHEFKAMFGPCLVTGFAHIEGHLVGILANMGGIGEAEAAKGTHFVLTCCERDIPLLFLQNTTDETENIDERDNVLQQSLSMKLQARMLAAVSCASVPKLTVIIGNGIGTSHYIMGGRAVSPNFLFAWPNARVSIMEPQKLAADIAQESDQRNDDAMAKLTERIERESSAIYGSYHMLNDGIILPQETRKVDFISP
ncbi:methylcrotonoyl-coa carboxylase beta chain, mitochondrial [Plakobranchus ocellatus]|uniref:methylcrotonoyl-CoA carboxylase n=1 Tax=Plakobranchus ocellatus TaxID=259542 RepID=A0AAV4BIZ4_9GAST|nr:methylcrotonoyl-coa carboxylase beta chain, mitochondrial [Plakobranchus ocellatus]